MASGFLQALVTRFAGKPVDWDTLEETLIRADLGVPLAMEILEALRQQGGELRADTIEPVAREHIRRVFPALTPPLRPLPARPKVLLLLGVNGAGKTTTAAKLAHLLHSNRHSVMLVAADTFRAAAIEQLAEWGGRIGVEVIKGQYHGDPAALCYDAYVRAHRNNVEFLVCDTAGRLHTKSNLMLELTKISRSLGKHHPGAPDEKWLVIDATTGTNALVQAREFNEAVGLTGFILTKADGSGKGGVAAAIQHELGIPPVFLGTGEKIEDLHPFERDRFVERLV